MNLNIVGYFTYFIITFIIISKVGRICYSNGKKYVIALIPYHSDLCNKINYILLVGYYLLNIGYCATTIISWATILTLNNLIEIIALKTAGIVLIIASIHYLNIYIITKYIKKLI